MWYRFRNILAFFALSLQPLMAQVNLNVTGMDATNYPEVSTFFTATNNSGIHYRDYQPSDFTVVEDGIPRQVLRVSCPPPVTPPVSITFTFDISNTMSVSGAINWAKDAAHALADLFEYPPASVGITVFDDTSYIWEPHSSNKTNVLQRIDDLQTFGGGTDIPGAFWDVMTGAIDFTKNQPGEKYIIFFTDDAKKIQTWESNIIVGNANDNNIKIFTVLLHPFDHSVGLLNIAQRTGGAYFNKVTSSQQAVDIFQTVGMGIWQWPPCEMVFLTTGCETTRSARITLSKNNRSDTETRTYTIPANKITTLKATPSFVDFGILPSNGTRTIEVLLSAANGNITVQSIQGSTGPFRIVDYGGYTPPYTIAEGESVKLTVEYRSSGPGKSSRRLEILSDADCQEQVILSAGNSEENTLNIIYPNGGEVHFVSDLLTYKYEGVHFNEKVAIEYSTNAGLSWYIVTPSAYDFAKNWLVADTPSDSCIALMYTGNNRANPKDSSWLPLHPSVFTSIDIGASSAIMAAGLSDGRVKLFYPWDGTLSRIISAHGGSVNDLVFSRDARYLATAGGDRRIKVWNTADGSLAFQSPAFGAATYAVAFSEDGNYLAGSDNSTVKLWSVAGWTQQWSVANQASANGGLVIDPKHRWVASARGNNIMVLNFANGSRIQTLSGHSGNVRSLDVTEDGWFIASGANDNAARIWNTFHWTTVNTLQSHSENINDVKFGPGGLQVATASNDNTVKIWDARKGTLMYTFSGHGADVNSVALGRRLGMVASVGDDKTMRVWTYNPSIADRSDSLWQIKARITDVMATTPQFDTLLCAGEFSEKTVYVYNKGNQPVTLTSLNITGADSANFTVTGGFSIPPVKVLAPEDSIAITVRFYSDKRGLHNALLQLGTDNPSIPSLGIQLEGFKEEAEFSISSPTLDFGLLYHCTVPVRRELIISNTGTMPLSIVLSGNDLPDLVTLISGLPVNLLPGESDTVIFEANTQIEALYNGTLAFNAQPCDITKEVTVNAEFLPSLPEVDPDPLVFDYTSVGDTSYKELTLKNNSKTPIQVIALIVSESEFEQIIPVTMPFTIATDGTEIVGFNFTPASEGTTTGQLMVITLTPCIDTVIVELIGSSSQKPAIAYDTEPFDALVCPDVYFSRANIVIRNTGGEDLIIDDYFVAGQHNADFSIISPSAKPISLSTNDTETFNIEFVPNGLGDRIAELVIISNAENTDTLRIALSARKDSVGFQIVSAPLLLGEVYHCSFPWTGTVSFQNTGTLPVSIELDPQSIAAPLTFAAGTFPLTVAVGAQEDVAAEIPQANLGTYGTMLRFTESQCSSEASLEASYNFVDSKALLSDSILDFGTIGAGSSSSLSLTITNPLQNAIRIIAVTALSSNASLTESLPSALPILIDVGGNIQIRYDYAPQGSDTLDVDLLIISDSPCNDTLILRLRGNSAAAQALVTLPTLSGRIGETVMIPLTLEQSSNLVLAGATSFTTDIQFNASMLWVTDVRSASGNVQWDTDFSFPVTTLHIEVNGSQAPQNGIIAEIECLIALGDAEQTTLLFDSFTMPNANVAISTRDGDFTAEGICRAGGDRLVALSDDIVLFQNAPNPFNPSTEISFTIPSDMHVDLRVYNALGREVELLLYSSMKEGFHSAGFDGSGKPSGNYFVVLRAGNGEMRIKQMVLTK
jgi:WD40 repeat protein